MTDRSRLPDILTARELEAWNLCEIRGMGQRTAALKLGITRSALRSRLESSRGKLRRHENLDSRDTAHEKILVREIKRAKAEGVEIKFPDRVHHIAPRPSLTAEEAERRSENYHERRRAHGSRTGAKQRGSDGTSRLTPRDLLAKQDGRCYLCQTPLTTATTQVEHIIPISRGGKHVDENLAAACAPCNLRKHDRIVAFDIRSRKPRYLT